MRGNRRRTEGGKRGGGVWYGLRFRVERESSLKKAPPSDCFSCALRSLALVQLPLTFFPYILKQNKTTKKT